MVLYSKSNPRQPPTVAAAQVLDRVKNRAKYALYSLSPPVSRDAVMNAMQNAFALMVSQDLISAFTFDVDLDSPKPLREVDCLPITARPGDALVVSEADDDGGGYHDEYRGVIVSADGLGRGVVFSQVDPRNGTEVTVKCSVRLMYPIETHIIVVSVNV